MSILYNRVRFTTTSTGTGNLVVGAVYDQLWMTPAEAGVANNTECTWVIIRGNDFEITRANYASGTATINRASGTTIVSRVGGTVGTSKINLPAGTTEVYISAAATDLLSMTESRTAGLVLASDAPGGVFQAPTFKALTANYISNWDAAIGIGGINTQTASYTLVLADVGKTVRMNVASANNLTVPPNSSVAYPTGTFVSWRQVGAGLTSLVAGSGVTLNSRGLVSLGQNAGGTLQKVATNTWDVYGDLQVVTAATGGSVTDSGGYRIHTFTSSGTFTVSTAGTAPLEYLIVAGGGGGGYVANGFGGGGGGGGGVLAGFLNPVVGSFTVTVGAGGSAGATPSTPATNGGNSQFGALVALGGGRGGNYDSVLGLSGGSGGGSPAPSLVGGFGAFGQGSSGGYGSPGSGAYAAGGGGGALSVGVDGDATLGGGAGGTGFSSAITGTAMVVGSGGGGGYYGPGGGGPGAGGTNAGSATTTTGGAGTANRGGGGGGGSYNSATNYSGGAGGSGIVVIRYPYPS